MVFFSANQIAIIDLLNMFVIRRPSRIAIEGFIAAQSRAEFSYAEVGATDSNLPRGYTMDHHRVRLGQGLPHSNERLPTSGAGKCSTSGGLKFFLRMHGSRRVRRWHRSYDISAAGH
jgi:hypothetical protein